MHVADRSLLAWWNGLPRAESWRGPAHAIRQRRGLSGVRKGSRRNVANAPHASVRVLFVIQSFPFCPVARAGWRSRCLHAAVDQHAREAVEGRSEERRVRASLPRALQVLPGGDRRVFLSSCALCRAECAARELGDACRMLALVKPSARRTRRPSVPDPLALAAGETGKLAEDRQRAAN